MNAPSIPGLGSHRSPKLGSPSGVHLSVRHETDSVPHNCGTQCDPLPPKFQSLSPTATIPGFTLPILLILFISNGARTPRFSHCNALILVGLAKSKPAPPPAFILAMISPLSPILV